MKRYAKSVLGVTLLEIMLVLAIAAMVIVMSVRYYQSASASQQSNATLETIQAITSAADGLAQGSGSYATGGVATSTVAPLLPSGGTTITSSWGQPITISGATGSTYQVTIKAVPALVCPLLASKLKANTNFTVTSGACGTTAADVVYTYTANP